MGLNGVVDSPTNRLGFWGDLSLENGYAMRKYPMFSIAVWERVVRMVFDTKDPYPSQAVIESSVDLMGTTLRSSADGEWLQPLQF